MSTKINANSVKSSFGKRVKLYRGNHNLSQEELGLDADLDLTSINEIENGHRNPKLITVCKLAKALDVSLADILQDIKL